MSPSGCPQACVVWVRWRSLAVDVMHLLATGLYNQEWAPRRYWKNNDEDVAAPFWAQEIIPVSNWVPQLQCSIHWFWGYPTDESFCIQSSIVSQHTGLQSLKRSQVQGGSGVGYPKSCPRKLHLNLNQDLKLDAIDFLSFPDEMYESQ